MEVAFPTLTFVSMNDNITNVTKEEINLVQLAAEDMRMGEIAEKLGIEAKTLSKRFDRIRSKNGCKSIAGLVSLFYREKLIS